MKRTPILSQQEEKRLISQALLKVTPEDVELYKQTYRSEIMRINNEEYDKPISGAELEEALQVPNDEEIRYSIAANRAYSNDRIKVVSMAEMGAYLQMTYN